jgi:hypothetical protein
VKVNVVVGVVQGCVDSAQVFSTREKTDEAENKLKEQLGVTEGMEGESENDIAVFYNVLVD